MREAPKNCTCVNLNFRVSRDATRKSVQSRVQSMSGPEEESSRRFESPEGQGQPEADKGWCRKAAGEAGGRESCCRSKSSSAGFRIRPYRFSRPGSVRAGCAPFAFAVTADSGPSQSRRWHPARNTRHGSIRKAAAAAAAVTAPVFNRIADFRRGQGGPSSCRHLAASPHGSFDRVASASHSDNQVIKKETAIGFPSNVSSLPSLSS